MIVKLGLLSRAGKKCRVTALDKILKGFLVPEMVFGVQTLAINRASAPKSAFHGWAMLEVTQKDALKYAQ